MVIDDIVSFCIQLMRVLDERNHVTMWPQLYMQGIIHILWIMNRGSVLPSPRLGPGWLRSLMSFAGDFRTATATSWDQSFVSATFCCLAHLKLIDCQRYPKGVLKCGPLFNIGALLLCSYSWNDACSDAGNPKLPSNLYTSVMSMRQQWFA